MFLRTHDQDPSDLAGASIATMVFGAIIAIAGVLILFWPGVSVVALAVIFAIQVIVSGIYRLVTAIVSQDAEGGRALMAVLGVLSIVIGILFLRHPFQTIAAMVLLVGLFWIISGLLETIHAISTSGMSGRGWAIVGGILAVIAGIIMLSAPSVGLIVLVWLLGLELLVYGAVMIARGVQARGMERHATPTARTTAGPAPA